MNKKNLLILLSVTFLCYIVISGCISNDSILRGQLGSERHDVPGPSIPMLRQPKTPTNNHFITIKGYADPRNKIDIYVNGRMSGSTAVDDDGKFKVLQVKLDEGKNTITAIATDWEGRTSDSSAIGKKYAVRPRSRTRPEIQVIYNKE